MTANERVPAARPCSARTSRTPTPAPSTAAWSSWGVGGCLNWKSILSPISGLKLQLSTGNFAWTASTTRFTSASLMSAMRSSRMRKLFSSSAP